MKNYFLGVFFILMSAFGFASMQLIVNLTPNIDQFTKVFFRNAITLIISIIILKRQKKIFFVAKDARLLLLFRSFLGFIGTILTFYAVSNMYIADATIIMKFSPFILIILCYFLYDEKISKYQIFAIILAFIGIIFIVKPSKNLINKGAIYAILAAFFAAGSYSCIRGLSIKKVDANAIIIVFSLFGIIVSIPFMIYFKPQLNLNTIILLFLIGIFGAIGQYGITLAYVFAPAKDISIFEYTQLLFSAIFGFIFLHQIPDILSVIGYFIVIFASLLSVKLNKK